MKDPPIEFIRKDASVHSLGMHTVPRRDFMRKFPQTILESRVMDQRIQFMGRTEINALEAKA
ncbi:hypothetical protein [Chromatocurvus halotolerans]|uniref:Uncharacterized protein n=1 Tax=Chromatocurvus halotolerans TaxID=1132028 RepID=A0A4R2KVM2_9GAMM|nr:hypothetical protein [Chromatocurvus halotolerans]TCO77873.1 hypothetical protein EV688_102333 [Chromatocurvus halotolerans]